MVRSTLRSADASRIQQNTLKNEGKTACMLATQIAAFNAGFDRHTTLDERYCQIK